MSEETNNNSTKRKTIGQSKWQLYLPLAMLIVGGGFVFWISNQIKPSLADPVEVTSDFTPVRLGDKSFSNEKISDQDFRMLALETDRAQLQRLRAKKMARKTMQHPDHASHYYQDRIEEMNYQLGSNFSQADTKVKGSVAYEMKKQIELMRQDAPQ